MFGAPSYIVIHQIDFMIKNDFVILWYEGCKTAPHMSFRLWADISKMYISHQNVYSCIENLQISGDMVTGIPLN